MPKKTKTTVTTVTTTVTEEVSQPRILVVLDRSGSMSSSKTETEGGFKNFLAIQREKNPDALISLYQFDDQYETVYEDKPVAEAPELTLVPRGMTALWDAFGRTLAGAEKLGGDNLIMVIITDGGENASQEYGAPQVKKMVQKARDKGWEIMFIGANIDTFGVGSSMGVARNASFDQRNAASINSAFTYAANSTVAYSTARGAGMREAALDAVATEALADDGFVKTNQ